MTYENVQTANLRVCQDCHSVVPHEEELLHTRWHEDIADALLEHGQLREELASADLRAAGNSVRADAAIRVAEAVRALREVEANAQPRRGLEAAAELWERVR